MNKSYEEKIAYKVSIVSIIFNVILSILKLISGIIAHSAAMISDSIHSISDVFSTFVVIIGVKLSNKKADSEHPYGHERLESVAAIILSGMLFFTGCMIGYSGIMSIVNNDKIITPGILALVAALISIVVKEAMYWYTRNASIKINSGALLADAWHHRSDALSSIGSLIGILGSYLGFPILDRIASIIIALFIVKVAYDIFKDSIDKMIDKSCDEKFINDVIDVINNYDDVNNIDDLKTRLFGNKAYIDIEISVNKDMSIIQAHEIAQILHDEIEKTFPLVKHCMIHVNPDMCDSNS